LKNKVPVTQRALFQRINRALEKEGQILKTTRGDKWRSSLGDYYVVDLNSNIIVSTHNDVEELGREVNALAPYESMEREK